MSSVPGASMVFDPPMAAPVAVLSLASFEIAPWLPTLVLWWAKPWLDRTVLFVLSRAAFAQRTSPGDLWAAQRHVWWGQLFSTLTWRRLSPWRSLTQPVYQLEGVSFWKARKRVLQIRRNKTLPALFMTSAYNLCESGIVLAVVSLAFWFAPAGQGPDVSSLFENQSGGFNVFLFPLAYALAVMFLEPFYVASGFAMYLSRRAELEAWDIEQEFRRAFGR